jgi:SRSO17 transposase
MRAGADTKGERLYAWTVLPLGAVAGQRRRWLVFRRSLGVPQELAYDVVSAPQQTPPAEMVRVAGTRWAMEASCQSTKDEVGLDHYEALSWAGWYRHVTLALLAHAYLTVACARAGAQVEDGQKKRPLSAKLRPRTSDR